MNISRTIDELIFKVQIYNIPFLPIDTSLTFLDLKYAVETSVDILYHLREEEDISYKNSQYAEAIKEFGISSDGVVSFGNFLPDASLWLVRFKSDFLSRFSTYIITVCNLDGILKKTYDNFLKSIETTLYNDLIPNETQQKESLEKRKTEIAHYTKLRNKVFAHTSYADPRKDSEELQSASLAFYSGRCMKYAEDHVYIEIGSPFIETNDKIEVRIFKDFSNTIVPHYNEWANMFTEILDKLPT